MSKFEVLVEEVNNVRDHPGADRLSLVDIQGFTVVTGKLLDGTHRYNDGDLVAYIPEGAVLPEGMLKEMGFWNETENTGTLNGSKGNRIKAMKLRGVISQGVVYPVFGEITGHDGSCHKIGLGFDVADILGVTKYEPTIPSSMDGDVFGHSYDFIYKFDIENSQKYPHIFQGNDVVNITEKIHGTQTSFIFTTEPRDDFYKIPIGDNIIYATAYSKGLGAKGLCFKANTTNLDKNIYLRSMQSFINSMNDIELNRLVNCLKFGPMVIMGETFGQGIQDLQYGTKPKFLAFDVAQNGKVLTYDQFNEFTNMVGLHTVPLLYSGLYEQAPMDQLRDGKSSLDGQTIKEGIVIRADDNTDDEYIGRKILKMISPNYLTRKSKDATEYQ